MMISKPNYGANDAHQSDQGTNLDIGIRAGGSNGSDEIWRPLIAKNARDIQLLRSKMEAMNLKVEDLSVKFQLFSDQMMKDREDRSLDKGKVEDLSAKIQLFMDQMMKDCEDRSLDKGKGAALPTGSILGNPPVNTAQGWGSIRVDAGGPNLGVDSSQIGSEFPQFGTVGNNFGAGSSQFKGGD